MLVAVYRNLNAKAHEGGREWFNHAWSVCKAGPNQLKTKGTKIACVTMKQQLLLLNAQACYGAEEKTVKRTGQRAVFAWWRGTWTAPSAVAYKVGRRLGMSPIDNGEFRFVYADNRQPCPAILAGVLFTAQGAFEVVL